jgi:ketosteroid isomerase-like protein
LTLDRLVEEGDTVAVVGHGCVSLGGDPVDFVYSEVFTFTDGLVSRLDAFHIWLGEVPA